MSREAWLIFVSGSAVQDLSEQFHKHEKMIHPVSAYEAADFVLFVCAPVLMTIHEMHAGGCEPYSSI